jgi:hypothetical protein
VPTKKATGKKATAKKATGKKATGKKATGKKATAKKATAKKATSRRSTQVVSQPGMTPARRAATRPTMPAKPGDFLVIDSAQVGSPPREGEVLEVIQGEVIVTYRVRWADGHQTLIGPTSGTARIVPASERA